MSKYTHIKHISELDYVKLEWLKGEIKMGNKIKIKDIMVIPKKKYKAFKEFDTEGEEIMHNNMIEKIGNLSIDVASVDEMASIIDRPNMRIYHHPCAIKEIAVALTKRFWIIKKTKGVKDG